ncbi:MAG: DUF4112 domain-containing protein [Coleofasciculus sp. S288]|nr:DUF4112 domain-containing protein [Coleofasciculus sp. S288]
MSQLPHPSSRPAIDPKTSTLRRLRRLSYVLDNAIPVPGTPYRIGLDPLLGLLPGGGDFLGAALSAYIVLEAARLGLPRATLVKMVSNILFETVLGSVPVLGDVVDASWKANAKNVTLVEEHLDIPRQAKPKTDWFFLALLLGGLLLVVIAVAAVSIAILGWLLAGINR